jgi:hypothetical protein
MAVDDKTEKIKTWQQKLEATFSRKYLASALAAEQATGGAFMNKFQGHRALTDGFMEFFGETLHSQWLFNTTKGWPQSASHYVPCLMMYLTLFRVIRTSEVLSASGYSLGAYATQRTIKDQLFVLCAAANNMAAFDELFGWKGTKGDVGTEQQAANQIKMRQKVENKIKSKIVGKQSGLLPESQIQLEKWDRMFNLEVHRSLFSWVRASQRLIVDRDLQFELGPELNWIALRLIPYMRRTETPKNDIWSAEWKLLDESFRFMFEGFSELDKKIAPAYLEMLETKFKFDSTTNFSEPKGGGGENYP